MPTPRKPTALKLLQGNPGKRKLPKNEPTPAPGCDPPPWLLQNAGAMARWERIAPPLLRLGVLTELDGEALGLMCALLAEAGEQSKRGPVDLRLSSELRGWMARFGLTPADRSRVSSSSPPEGTDPFAEWRQPSGGHKGLSRRAF